MNASICQPALATTIRCRIAASAALHSSAAAIAQWRKQPAVVGPDKIAPALLKHADDQTVLGLMTVCAARERQGWTGHSFADWGVIAAANQFGRIGIAQAIRRYRQEGAWGVSPNLVPHQSLHALSGTISQALKIHGPNFGMGGGPNAMPDAFLITAAMMMDGQLPGLWLVLAGYETEWLPAAEGDNSPAPRCCAVALALTTSNATSPGLHLSIGQAELELAALPEFQVGLLADEISGTSASPAGKWRLDDAHWVELDAEPGDPEGRS